MAGAFSSGFSNGFDVGLSGCALLARLNPYLYGSGEAWFPFVPTQIIGEITAYPGLPDSEQSTVEDLTLSVYGEVTEFAGFPDPSRSEISADIV